MYLGVLRGVELTKQGRLFLLLRLKGVHYFCSVDFQHIASFFDVSKLRTGLAELGFAHRQLRQ
jgi:hypothetical protein